MSEPDLESGLDNETTTVAVAPAPPAKSVLRQAHRAAFDATLKEVFLGQQVQLREPIGAESKETVVYGGLYQGEEVAVKVFTLAVDDLRDAISAYGAFKVECEKTMILSRAHSDVVQVVDYGDADLPDDLAPELREFFPLGLVPFMITERAPYGSLDRCIRNLRKLPGFSRVGLMTALAAATDGIKEAHKHQVAHRDIKPQNILIFGPESGKIADFGIARWRSRMHRSSTAMLTPRYSSPEQAFHALTGQHEGLVGRAGDIYSWATMVYELVTGKHPFDWAIKAKKDHLAARKAILQAIAANDRRGFVPTGDITFDSLMHACTCDLKQRITDIEVANRVLRQVVQRMRAA
jgi:serine/threonine protein kinase